MPHKLLERLLIDRNTLQTDLEAVFALLTARLAKKYGWSREVTARFLEHQAYVAVLRFQSSLSLDRSVLEFERALTTVQMEADVAAQAAQAAHEAEAVAQAPATKARSWKPQAKKTRKAA